ncbi:MAG: hypothetical protein O7B23_14615 [Deltaproteobacteria bacterium]|nr:hypothetical protein [Deltaproteobacteria bacterium]
MAERKVRDGRALLGIPVSALAALPVCPACYPAYAGLLSALGLGALANTTAQTVLTALLLSLALISLLYRARSRRGLGPFVLGVTATFLVIVSKFVLGFDGGTYIGVGVLIVAGVWNVWPQANAARDSGLDDEDPVQFES